MARKPKKDETIEVRLPHETKVAFMERCKAEGRTASEAVRGFIDAHLARSLTEAPEKEPAMNLKRAIPLAAAASVGVIALSLFTASPSRAGPDLAAMFKMMDANGDGNVTVEEFTNNPGRPRMIAFKAERPPEGPPPVGGPDKIMIPLGPPPPGAELGPPGLPPGMRMVDDETRKKMEGEMFADIDANKDGKVSLAEFETHHRDMIKRSFAALDKNKDGAITAEEFDRRPIPRPRLAAAMFSRLDKNKDGKISEKEFMDRG
jgi:Ca2+-binding EF-hand superfamily protein